MPEKNSTTSSLFDLYAPNLIKALSNLPELAKTLSSSITTDSTNMKDKASKERFKELEAHIKKLEKEYAKEYADFEEIWKREKSVVQGAQHLKEELEQAKSDLELAFESISMRICEAASSIKSMALSGSCLSVI
jgi:molecular chaperone GrpE (heat shock protein)